MQCSWLYTFFMLIYESPTDTLSYAHPCSSSVPESISLISNTLSCIFVWLQILHVRRNPEVLPHISLTMLMILSLEHMVSLALNVESMFASSDGWLNANEAVMRLASAVAFLLHMRLVRLVWAAKRSRSLEESMSSGEMRSVLVSTAVYVFGGLVTLLWNLTRNERYWGDLRFYAGLIVDGFLFPQILLTVFSGSIEKPLSRSFCFGVSGVRVLSHVYNHYNVWDLVVIPSGVIALALIVDQI